MATWPSLVDEGQIAGRRRHRRRTATDSDRRATSASVERLFGGRRRIPEVTK